MSDTGDFIVLDWYDGPLTEVASFKPAPTKLVEFRAYGWATNPDGTVCPLPEGAKVHLRLEREELLAALDLINGKPVTDFFGDVVGGDQ